MKTLLLTFVLSLFCACSFSQKITGKWSCDKEVVQALRLEYNDIYCTYKFKKDGINPSYFINSCNPKNIKAKIIQNKYEQ
jgi:hypothetical protein